MNTHTHTVAKKNKIIIIRELMPLTWRNCAMLTTVAAAFNSFVVVLFSTIKLIIVHQLMHNLNLNVANVDDLLVHQLELDHRSVEYIVVRRYNPV